ncbi:MULTISPECIES: Type 1 glutamine amidotransferase-like domain-containing protein [unclassified Bifidobacterium]|uniref:Type 1 glutamine amidotransferase-like domain-containing protein n=1 Tax=unclassified Bifidobacterium TaxID=2608897 RepID=UPI0023F67D9A|nr:MULTISPECIES: Type 1 glutamine amidotransferase-like domain-containing protein [unclassified Bifidobacterium]WEV65248.1 Type 1 glutamine amidotransferase-like domain-containing protein [Bifidobacterium sp. ESL0764]WEV75949.1 Type 1 glutamine amidotransferase-like domain-containing protein [Bifidobacterium sp. ESL0800]
MARMILASRVLPALHALRRGLSRRHRDPASPKWRIAYIPAADDHELSRWFRPLVRLAMRLNGFRVRTVDLATTMRDEVKRSLAASDVIWVGGGNSFHLLHELKRSGAGRVIASLVHAGKPYVGVSAGAVVAAPDISYIEPMDDRAVAADLDDTAGLNLVDFRVIPHLDHPFMGRAARLIASLERRRGHVTHVLEDAWTVVVNDAKVLIHRR